MKKFNQKEVYVHPCADELRMAVPEVFMVSDPEAESLEGFNNQDPFNW